MDELYLQLLTVKTLTKIRKELHGYSLDVMSDLMTELRETSGQDRKQFHNELGLMITVLDCLDKVITEKEGVDQ